MFENSIKESIKNMKRLQAETLADNRAFKDHITDDYVEFFRSKKRMRQEWTSYV